MTDRERLALSIESTLRLHEKVARNMASRKGDESARAFTRGHREAIDDLAGDIRTLFTVHGIGPDQLKELIAEDSEFWVKQREGVV